jgi:olfactory receptor
MPFFLKNLSLVVMCYTSITIPKGVITSFKDSGVISYLECAAQLYIFITISSTHRFLLTVIAYDQCLSTLKPLLCGTTMSQKPCSELVVMAWVSRVIFSALHTLNTYPFLSVDPMLLGISSVTSLLS